MRPEKFWILVILSLTIAALVILEISNERQTLRLTFDESDAQAKVMETERQHEVLLNLLQRMANTAQTDPALGAILTKHGIHTRSVTGQDTNALPPASSTSSLPATIPTGP
ncbi:MAG: hypothetical protein LV479_04735 [Methylacidiphilales bacterium]|nr:hypothetical protein [Candidatus Methylacidiphilales bacterium]